MSDPRAASRTGSRPATGPPPAAGDADVAREPGASEPGASEPGASEPGASEPEAGAPGTEALDAAPAPPAGCSRDTIGRGRLALWQPRRGYRFSVDALLVAHFSLAELPDLGGGRAAARDRSRAPRRPESLTERARLVDLGAGCGVVGLALAQATPGWGATLVELQPRLAALCRLNVAEADLADRVEVCEADLRHRSERLRGAAFSLAVSNPPFRPADAGRQSPDPERARAHSEQTLTLPSLVDAAARLLRPGGAFCVVYPAERLPALLSACATADLRPTRLRLVHPRPDQPARRVLLAARKGGGRALEVASPLFVHTEAGEYSPEAAVILDGAWLDGT